MKNKPGTVAPANITKLCRLEAADQNRVEFIYANSTKASHYIRVTVNLIMITETNRGYLILNIIALLGLSSCRQKDFCRSNC